MIRREPTAITLGINDVVDFDELRRMYQQEEAWRVEVAKKAQQDNHEADYLFNQTMNKNINNDDKNNDTANEETSSGTSNFLSKRRRIANNSTSQRRAADARKRLGIDNQQQQQQQSIYKMGRQV